MPFLIKNYLAHEKKKKTHLRNRYLKKRYHQNRKAYTTQPNSCVSLPKKTKKPLR